MEIAVHVFFFTLAGLFPMTGALISITTPDQGSYRPLEPDGISVQSVTNVRFLVKATSDVHVGLYPGTSYSPVPQSLYEIVIGGWSNSKSTIRKKQQGSNLDVKNHVPLSQATFKAFWVSWNNGVRVGTGAVVGENVFLFLSDSGYAVKYVAIFTAFGSTGDWRFEDYPLLSSSSFITPETNSASASADQPSSSIMDQENSKLLSVSIHATQTYISLTVSAEQTSTYMKDLVPSVESTGFDNTGFEGQTTTYMDDLRSSLGDTDFVYHSTLMHATPTIYAVSASTQQFLYTKNKNMATDVYTNEHLTTSLNQKDNNNTEVSSKIILSTALGDSMVSSINPSTSMADVDVKSGVTSFGSISTTTSAQSTKQPRCGCQCMYKNITAAEIRKIANRIVKRLSVSKTNLSSTRRKFSSAHDERPSSQGIGAGVVLLAILPIILVILSDIQTLVKIFCKK